METMIVVLMLLAVASAYPYSPYTDHKGEPKNVQLSEEAVAAYLKSKMKDENLEPAKIMNYVETLLQGKPKGTTETPKDPQCLLTGVTDYSLKSSELDMILNTVYPTTGSLRPHATILTPDHGKNMYINELNNPLGAYQSMLDGTTGEISNIWANYSPCPSCVRKLLSHYKEGDDKPTIYVARIFTESDNLSDVVTSLQCLAKLGHKGFKVVAWNFSEFSAPLDQPVFIEECASAITAATNKENFTSTLSELGKHVTFIQELGENARANSWCDA